MKKRTVKKAPKRPSKAAGKAVASLGGKRPTSPKPKRRPITV